MFGNIYGLDLGTYEIKVFDKKIKLYNIGYSNKNRFQYEVLESSV